MHALSCADGLAAVQCGATECCRLGSQDREKVESLESEIRIMRTLRHPNVCGYLGTERSEGEDTKILNILLE